MSFIDRVSMLSVQERIRFFHLLSRGICLHARGLASDNKKSPDLRLLQSDAIVEMLHRIFEQSEHYYKQDDAQRPEADLFEALQSLETRAHLHGIISSASEYAFQKLSDAVLRC
jgi:hypothetical protein